MAQANEMQRRSFLGSVTKTVNRIAHLLDNHEMGDDIDAQLEQALTDLEIRWDKYEEAQTTALMNLDPTELDYEATYDRAFNAQEDHRDTMSRAKTLAERARREWANVKEQAQRAAIVAAAAGAPYQPVAQVNVAAPNLHVAAPQINFEVNQPNPPQPHRFRFKPLEPQIFKGEITEWRSFWAMFQSSVDTQDYTNVEKLTLLRQHLKDDALLTIKALAITEANYPVAVQALIDRYNDPNLAISTHLAELDNLPSIKSTSEIQKLR